MDLIQKPEEVPCRISSSCKSDSINRIYRLFILLCIMLDYVAILRDRSLLIIFSFDLGLGEMAAMKLVRCKSQLGNQGEGANMRVKSIYQKGRDFLHENNK